MRLRNAQRISSISKTAGRVSISTVTLIEPGTRPRTPSAWLITSSHSAASWWLCNLGRYRYDPHDLADYYINLRKSLSGWDLAAHVRAARLAGFDVYSVGIVEQLLARRVDWEHVLYGGWDYTESSWGALLRAMLELHAAGSLPPALYADALAMADLLIADINLAARRLDEPDEQSEQRALAGA